ncbi:MAG TPA: hypothetical protein VK430_12675 [Xanthobacteraceae bacterium]|nr:hypothetical protein [Xanthobacteraceae bacterium]
MSTISLETTARPRRVSRWSAIIGGGTTALMIGLLTVGYLSTTAARPKLDRGASVSEPVVAPLPTALEIVPSPVIETGSQMFFGTGDGSAGFYAERPSQ